MTNEQAKQEAIKKAYGEHWDKVKEFVNEDGWIFSYKFSYYQNINGMSEIPIINIFGGSDSQYIVVAELYCDNRKEFMKVWKPLVIMNIQTNNGWIRIEPDGSNLPERDLTCKWLDINNANNRVEDNYNFVRTGKTDSWLISTFTHYKLITPEEPPIY